MGACGQAAKWRPGWRANSGSRRSCLNAAGRRSRRSAGPCRSPAPAIPPPPRPRSARRLKKAGHGRCRGSGKAPGQAGRGLDHGRAPHRLEADPAPGVGPQGSAADRAWPPPLQVVVRHRLRPANLGRDLLVRVERVSKPFFAALLALFAREAGAGRDRIIVLGLDSAGWHTAPNLAVPDGIRLAYLPPYSPELQPAEHLWPVLDEPLANQYFATLADLEHVVTERCRMLNRDQLKPGVTSPFAQTCTLSGAGQERGGNIPERPQAVGRLSRVPIVLARERDVLPAERRNMGEQFVGDTDALGAEVLDGTVEIGRVPVDDGCRQQAQPRSPEALVLECAVAELALTVEEHGSA